MTIQKILRTIMKSQRFTQLRLSKLSDIPQSTINGLMNRGGKFETYVALLETMGYEVCIRPQHRGALADDNYVVGLADEPEVVEEPEISWYAALSEK